MEQSPKKEIKISHTRHGEANYEAYKEILRSPNPQGGFDPERQPESDLTENGKEKAAQEAVKFFDGFNPEKDELFFVASNETRAIETADIYRQEAHKRGFQILKSRITEEDNPKAKSRKESGAVEKNTEGEIRVIDTISINYDNALLNAIFAGPKQFEGLEINWSAVPQDFKEKFERARKIIIENDQGSWGANFFHHSKAIKEIFPEIVTAEAESERKFNNLLRLSNFAAEKINESGRDVKVLVFGHENYMGVALDKYFGNHEIKNLETVNIIIGEDGAHLEKGGVRAKIE